MLTQLPPLSLYIHFPWCIQKCPYCDFNSHSIKQDIPESQYIEILLQDLENDLPLVWGRKVNTIFMGGGTPSLFSPEAMETLLAGIRARIPLSPNAEITMEANPGTVENERLAGFRETGINRLSLGIQSFNDQHLKRLGRIHDSAIAINAIEAAKQAGFDNFNLDLMFGLPNQTIKQAVDDVKTALSFSPTHISYYQLTLEPNTEFHHNPPPLPGDEQTWEIYNEGKRLLFENSFQQYEVSAYSQEKHYSRHNKNYWLFGDYLGIGAGAHAKITDGNQQSITRYWKHRHPKDYLSLDNASKIAGKRKLEINELVFEFLLNALRLTEGFQLNTFQTRTGLKADELQKNLEHAVSQGLVIWNNESNQIKTSEKGQLFLNNILENLLPENLLR